MQQAPTPFSCEYTPQFANLLHNLNISLAVSTYQAGKVIILSAVETDKLIQLPRTFDNAMGMATAPNRLAVAAKYTVEVLENAPALAPHYPQKPNVYDAMYVPRATYHTGYLAMHDMAFMGETLVGVNTLFSCICHIDHKHSFTPIWKPPFISELTAHDRCHLNGMATQNGEIKYLTALGNTNTVQGWRENKMQGGIVMEYPSGRIITEGLGMPHSPRVYNGKLYVLNSTKGELIHIDTQTGKYDVVCKLGGFARGMDLVGDYLFIGVSKLRHNSAVFADLEIAKTSFAGVIAVYLPYGSIVGQFKYHMTVDEIYDVKILPAAKRASVVSPDMDIKRQAITIPNGAMWGALEPEKKTELVNDQPSEQKKKSHGFEFQINSLNAQQLLQQYHKWLLPSFASRLHNNTNAEFVTITATQQQQLAAIAVLNMRSDGKSVQLQSVCVLPEYQKQGLGTRLLFSVEDIARQRNIKYIDTFIYDTMPNTEAIKHFFANAGWGDTRYTQEIFLINNAVAVTLPWVKKMQSHSLDNVEIFDWENLTDLDVATIQTWNDETIYPAYLNPLRNIGLPLTHFSCGARVEGNLAGWCTVHKVNDQTVQCSSLFVQASYRHLPITQMMLARFAIHYQSEPIKYSLFQIMYSDELMRRLMKIFFAADKAAIEQSYHTLTWRKQL